LQESFSGFQIDGSTSMIPLHQGLRRSIGNNNDEVYHNRTVWAFENLISGYNDILLSVSFSDELMQKAANSGLDLQQLPITREAFVFLINANNPVQSLTTEQIKGIYSGEITNWSEVGGDDAPITAFQRNSDSGSQMRMVKFMGDTPLIDKDVTYVQGMGDIMEKIENFDEGKYSIAYNMYTFTEKQYPSEDVVMLAVDGVLPTDETIQDDTYPIVIYNYIFYDANNAENTEFALNLYAFLMSGEGQKLISDRGYVNLNRNFDRNMNITIPEYWTTNSERDGEGYISFYNAERGEYYAPTEDGELLIFDNYADYIFGITGTDGTNLDGARAFLTAIENSELPKGAFTTHVWENRFSYIPYGSVAWESIEAFNFRYDGKYYIWLIYFADEDRLILEGTRENTLEHINKEFEAYLDDIDTGELEITLEDLKDVYVRMSDDWWQYIERGEPIVINYFKPFN
jgi:phosphate transport system substrate-binding protein